MCSHCIDIIHIYANTTDCNFPFFLCKSMFRIVTTVSRAAGIAFTDVAKKLAEQWKAATADEKTPFEEAARKDKERYQTEMEAYKKKKAAEEADDGDEGANGDGDE
jgi:hypothetical protein